MKRSTIFFLFMAGLMLALVMVGCVSAPTSAPAAPATTTYIVSNANRSVDTPAITAEITWDGQNWTCNVQNCAQNKQINGNTMEFWVSMTKIAVEDTENPGQLIPETGFVVTVK